MSAGEQTLAVYEIGGDIACGEVQSVGEKSLRLADGQKIPNHRVWLKVPASIALSLEEARHKSGRLDIENVWKAAAGESLDVRSLAQRMGDDDATSMAAVLHCALAHPIYFRRHGGRLSPAPAAAVAGALQSQHQRRRDKEQIDALTAALRGGEIPPQILRAKNALLAREDRNSDAYRALKKVVGGGETAFARFFLDKGVLPDVRAYWRELFEYVWPPRAQTLLSPRDWALPKAPAPAFSIDDVGTVEVDDAFSVETDAEGRWRIGVHIAAPALVILSGDKTDLAAQKRMTSVYFPDEKHFMLPPDYVRHCSLEIGEYRPAVSLYQVFDPAAGNIIGAESAVNLVMLDDKLTPEMVEEDNMPAATAAAYQKLKQFAHTLPDEYANRQWEERGEYVITAHPPAVRKVRRRGVSRVIEMLMRNTNVAWAQIIRGHGGAYRCDGRITAKSDSPPYAWFTSPLRRYADLANQRLLLSLLPGESRPSSPQKWRDLARGFNKQYSLARDFQRSLNRHWTLCALQELDPAAELRGVWTAHGKVRLCDYPILGKISRKGEEGGEITVRIESVDLLRQSLRLR